MRKIITIRGQTHKETDANLLNTAWLAQQYETAAQVSVSELAPTESEKTQSC